MARRDGPEPVRRLRRWRPGRCRDTRRRWPQRYPRSPASHRYHPIASQTQQSRRSRRGRTSGRIQIGGRRRHCAVSLRVRLRRSARLIYAARMTTGRLRDVAGEGRAAARARNGDWRAGLRSTRSAVEHGDRSGTTARAAAAPNQRHSALGANARVDEAARIASAAAAAAAIHA